MIRNKRVFLSFIVLKEMDKLNRNIHTQEDKQYSSLDSECIDQPAHMRMLINVFTFNICKHMRLVILPLAC